MHFIYGFCDGDAAAAVREYRRRYPHRRHPSARVFVDTHRRFREFGLRRRLENVHVRQRINENPILRTFDNNPGLSSRRVSRQLLVSKSTVLRVLHDDHRRAYHLQPVQHLHPGDEQKRLNFCQWLLHSIEVNPELLQKILWTDEATFTRSGIVNYHNMHMWANENPHAVRPRSFQQEFSINVWLGIIDGYVCGPYALPRRLNGELFHDFLENHLFELLENVPLDVRNGSWIQMDGAPAHSVLLVRDWMNANYPERWIGRFGNNDPQVGRGTVAWPPRSPDLTPLDFYVWGCLKNKVYATPIRTRNHLLDRIQQACLEMRENRHQVSGAINSLIRRCRRCIDVGGSHFEQLL